MEREIKFRVFDEENKKMYSVNSIWGFPIVEHVTIPHKDTVKTLFYNLKLMQFTGLKDKKGKEIYEGDMVRHEAWDYPFEVIFNQEKSRFVCKMKSGLTQYIDNNKIEVIGNIHEI